MYTLIPLTLLLLRNGLHSEILQTPEMAAILSKARALCPYNSLCGEPPLSTSTLSSGKTPCCSDCSCQPDCYLRNDCCFPTQGKDTVQGECLYAASRQEHGPALFGSTIFHMVVDVKTCGNSSTEISNETLSSPLTTENTSDCKMKHENVNRNCSRCNCNTVTGSILPGKCTCDSSIINKNNDCKCGDAQIASWGSIFPVYSLSSRVLYKNPVCAACHGVSGGVMWNPLITCDGHSVHFVDKIVEKTLVDSSCTVIFTAPARGDHSDFPRCWQETKKETCSKLDTPVSYAGQNMTAEEVHSACHSNFTSPVGFKHQNVFCFICSGEYKTDCDINPGFEIERGTLTMLLPHDLLDENSRKGEDEKYPMACSKSTPSDCRKILCPSGHVRNADGVCVYPLIETHVKGYEMIIRLYPEIQAPIQETINLLPSKTLEESHLITPWPKTWLKAFGLLENSRILSSGDVANKTSLIIKIAFTNPSSDIKSMLETVKHVLEKKCFLKVNNLTVAMKSEFFERKEIVFKDKRTATMTPIEVLFYENKLNIPVPEWKVQWDRTYLQTESFLPLSKLMFCDQIMLHENDYSFRAERAVLYLKPEDKFLFNGEFFYMYVQGYWNVRLCLDDTDFVKVVSSSQTYFKNVAVYVIMSALFLSFCRNCF